MTRKVGVYLALAAVLALSAGPPAPRGLRPDPRRPAAHPAAPQATPAAGKPGADQALENPDLLPPDFDVDLPFDPWDLPEPPDDFPLPDVPPDPWEDPFVDLALPSPEDDDPIPFDPSFFNGPWIDDFPFPDIEIPLPPEGDRVAASSSQGLAVAIAQPGRLPVIWHARGDTLRHLYDDLSQGPITIPVPGAPTSPHGQSAGMIAVADLNGDGALDAVRIAGNALYVNLGKSPSGWNPHKTYPLPIRADHVIVADVNGDGKPDIIASSIGGWTGSDPGGVCLLLNNGDGTFKPATALSSLPNPTGIAVADFNQDGKADLAVASGSSAQVSVLLGKGDGTFQAPVTYAVGGLPVSMAVADFNGDGRADIVTSNPSQSSVSVLLSNGDGTFRPAVNSTGIHQSYSTSLAFGDLNGDARLDLVVANYDDNTVLFLIGQGDGSFQAGREFAAGAGPSSVAVLPGGHEGYAVLTSDDLTQRTRMFIGTNGKLTGRPVYKLGTRITGVALADLNGDGVPDVVAADQGGVLVALGGAHLKDKPASYPASLQDDSPAAVAVADLNGDGKLDVVAASSGYGGGPGTLAVLLGHGDGTLAPFRGYAAGTRPVSVVLADLNGDGKLDAVVGDGGDFPSGANGGVSILLGHPDGTFGSATSYSTGQYPAVQVQAADLNGDGKPDVIAAVANLGGDDGGVQVFLNKGDGTLQAPVNLSFTEPDIKPQGFAVGDVNGDGKADLVVAYRTPTFSYKLAVMLGNGDGTFSEGQVMDDDFGTGPPLLLDLNGDGKLDLLVPHCCGDTEANHRLGNGDGTFQDPIYDGSGPSVGAAAATTRKSGRPLIALAGDSGLAVFMSLVPGTAPAGSRKPLTDVSAASFLGPNLAPESIASGFGSKLATGTAGAESVPLPTSLAGSTVTIHDSAGVDRRAPLFYVSPTQINYLVPAGTALGNATVTVTAGDGTQVTDTVPITAVAPGVFTFNAAGLAAAQVVRASNGQQTYEDLFQLDSTGNIVAKPIDLGPSTDQVFLILYGTGIRAAATSGTTVTIGGWSARVDYAGSQGYWTGLDQVNVLIPRSLIGAGDVPVDLTASGASAKAVRIAIR